MRRLVGNLDVETAWARRNAAWRRARGEPAPAPADPRFALPPAVLRRVSESALEMAVLARSDEDRLWTPVPVDPSLLRVPAGHPRPRLESGPLDALPAADETVWFGDPGDVAARVNHRAFVFELAHRLAPLPGAALVRSAEELVASLPGGRWVLKPAYSAAGRGQVHGSGRDEAAIRRAGRTLELHGCGVLEPWVDRLADFGASGEVGQDGAVRRLGRHTLVVGARGGFRAVRCPAEGVSEEETAALDAAVVEGGELLASAGFAGPFGVDAYRWRDAAGATRFRALSELNARLTFGHLAHQRAINYGAAANR